MWNWKKKKEKFFLWLIIAQALKPISSIYTLYLCCWYCKLTLHIWILQINHFSLYMVVIVKIMCGSCDISSHCFWPTRIRLMPARETCWQSYSSMRSRRWQLLRCSSVMSVIKGQLSNSTTCRRSWPHTLLLRCLIPSSVINSQCDRL